jgi:phage terminase Nu1 subunit (DNA packaging protein)
MLTEMIASTDLVVKTCGQCGVVFALPRTLDDANFKAGSTKTWYCPNGHGRVYRESKADKLERELQQERQRLDQARADANFQRTMRAAAERSARAARGQVTKIKNRVSKGVCPCCNRYFANLHRHMTTQHPDYTAEPVDGAPIKAE